jgi:hypothetical protein
MADERTSTLTEDEIWSPKVNAEALEDDDGTDDSDGTDGDGDDDGTDDSDGTDGDSDGDDAS